MTSSSCTLLLVVLARLLGSCASETASASISVSDYAFLMPVTTTNMPTIFPTPTTSIAPTASSLPPMLPKPTEYFSFAVIRKWILKHPIITGLSAATTVLSFLLLCMCYLWTCKRRKHIIYYVVGDSELDEKEEDEEAEVHCNPDATTTNPDTDDPDTEDDIDSGISGEGRTRHPAVARRASTPSLSPSVAAASAQVVMELKAAQGAAAANPNSSHQETALVTGEPEPSHRETDTDFRRSEHEVAATDYEEIPSLDSLTFDWQVELPATFSSSSEWAARSAAQNSDSLNLSEISDIA